MPYKVKKQGSKYVTYSPENNHVFGVHPTKSGAERQQRALWSNAPPGKEHKKRKGK